MGLVYNARVALVSNRVKGFTPGTQPAVILSILKSSKENREVTLSHQHATPF